MMDAAFIGSINPQLLHSASQQQGLDRAVAVALKVMHRPLRKIP